MEFHFKKIYLYLRQISSLGVFSNKNPSYNRNDNISLIKVHPLNNNRDEWKIY